MDRDKLLEEYQNLKIELRRVESRINEIRIKQRTESSFSYTTQDKNDFQRWEEIKSRMQQIENLIKTNNEK